MRIIPDIKAKNIKKELINFFFFKSLKKTHENMFPTKEEKEANPNIENSDKTILTSKVKISDFLDFNFFFQEEQFLEYIKNPKHKTEVSMGNYKKILSQFIKLEICKEHKKQFKKWIENTKRKRLLLIDEIPFSFEDSIGIIKKENMNAGVIEYIKNEQEMAIRNSEANPDDKESKKAAGNWNKSFDLDALIYNNVFVNDNEYNKSLLNYKENAPISVSLNYDYTESLKIVYDELKFKGFNHTLRVFYNIKSSSLTPKGVEWRTWWWNRFWFVVGFILASVIIPIVSNLKDIVDFFHSL